MGMIQHYLEDICTAFREHTLSGLPNAGELLSRTIQLKDIYLPVRLLPVTERKDSPHESLAEFRKRKYDPPASPTPEAAYARWQESYRNAMNYLQEEEAEAYLLSPARCLVIGDPSTGKTLLSRHTAYAYAYAQLHGGSENAEETQTAQELLDVVKKQRLRLPDDLIPFTTSGGVLQKLLSEEQTLSVDELLYASYCELPAGDTFEPIRAGAFQAILSEAAAQEQMLLIVDAVDELFDPALCLGFLEKLQAYLHAHPQVHLLMTGRSRLFISRDADGSTVLLRSSASGQDATNQIRGMKETLGLRMLEIQKLTREDIAFFTRRWYTIVDKKSHDFIRRSVRSIQEHAERLKLMPFLENIMYLTLTLIIVGERGTIPDSRDELFENLLELILKTQPKNTLKRNPLRSYDETLWLVSYVACAMTEKNMRIISLAQLKAFLRQGLDDLRQELSRDLTDEEIADLCDFLITQACILVGSDQLDSYTFFHLQIQENLCSVCLRKGMYGSLWGGQSVLDIFTAHCTDPAFTEILYFSLASGDAPQFFNYPLINRLITCGKENPNRKTLWTTLFNSIILGGKFRRDQCIEVYDHCFRNGMQKDMLPALVEFLSLPSSDGFRHYIMEAFRRSCADGKLEYSAAASVMMLYDSQDTGILPAVRKLLHSGDFADAILGYQMLGTALWAQFPKPTLPFVLKPEDFCDADFRRCIDDLQKEDYALRRVAANFIFWYSKNNPCLMGTPLTDELFLRMAERLKNNIQDKPARLAVSGYPMSAHNLALHHRIPGIGALQRAVLDYRPQQKTLEGFNLCLLLGCRNTDRLLEHLPDIKGLAMDKIITFHPLFWQENYYRMRSFTIEDGIECYEKGDIDGAVSIFTIQAVVVSEEPRRQARSFLADMLRRGEVREVWLEGQPQTVETLLAH